MGSDPIGCDRQGIEGVRPLLDWVIATLAVPPQAYLGPMPRPPRLDYEGGWYHVMNRGAGRRPIFEDDRDRTMFLELLAEQRFEVHAYCTMGNHFHLLVHTPAGGLSDSMQNLSGRYTQWFNARHSTDGPVFRGRFKSVLVDSDSYLASLSRYIHLNPVVAGMVAKPDSYEWSSYLDFVGLRRPPVWLHMDTILAMAGGRRSYADFVEAPTSPTDVVAVFYAKARIGPVLGTDAFADEARAHVRRSRVDVKAGRGLTPRVDSLGSDPIGVGVP